MILLVKMCQMYNEFYNLISLVCMEHWYQGKVTESFEIWSSHRDENVIVGLLGCNAMWTLS
jgi:hypothetical protein